MRKINNFGETLGGMKDICGMKSVTLANYLGYDISYISKWCSNKKLPSGRNITHILDELTRIFSREIYNSNLIHKFNLEYKTDIKNSEELAEYIRTILEDSYDRSKKSEGTIKKNYSKTIFGKNEIGTFIKERIYEILRDPKREVEVYCTLDILNFEIIYQDKELQMKELSRVDVKIGCDLNKLIEDDFKKVYDIHYILSRYINSGIQIYDNKEFNKNNVFLVKDEFAVVCSLNEYDKPDFAVFITDSEEVEKIYGSINCKFNSSNVLIDTVSEEELKEKQYVLNFYNSNKFNFLFNLNFDFLNPRLMIGDFKLKDESTELINKQLLSLEGILERKLSNSEVNIFIESHMLNEFIYSFLIVSSNTEVLEILNRIEKLVGFMKNNSSIRVYLVEGFNNDTEISKYDLSVYCGEHFILMKKHKNFKDKFYIVKNAEILKQINRICNEMKEEKYSRELSIEEFTNLLKDYKKMV